MVSWFYKIYASVNEPLVAFCRAPNLLLSSTFCYLWLLAGYIGMTMASNVYWMCLSIMVKSFGSSVMWVYSTLLLQLRVPDAMLGRMMALEMAFFTVS